MTGCQDGSIRMWEWSHSQPVQNVRPPGVFAKVNRVRFTSQGNKFGACDGDGNVALWQAANASQPFFVRSLNQTYAKCFMSDKSGEVTLNGVAFVMVLMTFAISRLRYRQKVNWPLCVSVCHVTHVTPVSHSPFRHVPINFLSDLLPFLLLLLLLVRLCHHFLARSYSSRRKS